MEAREYGLTRWACFVARHLEVVAVIGLLWVSCCVLGGANLLDFFSFFARTHTDYYKYEAISFLIYTSTSTDCENCTRLISTNPESMEAGEYELTRGTCSIACRLELHAVAGLLRISWCVRMGRNSPCFSFPIFFLRTHTACCKYEATSGLHCLPTSNETRPKERSDRGFFLPIGEKNSSYRGAYRVPLFKLSVGMFVRVCGTFVIFIDCDRLYETDFSRPGIYGIGRVWVNAWEVFYRTPSRDGCGCRPAGDFVVCFRCEGFFLGFTLWIFSARTHTACWKYEVTSCLFYLSTSNEAKPK